MGFCDYLNMVSAKIQKAEDDGDIREALRLIVLLRDTVTETILKIEALIK